MIPNYHFVNFRNECRSTFKFSVLVITSEEVKKVLAKYNLTGADFLRPFGKISPEKKIKIRSLNSKEKLINDFSLNFLDYEEYQSPTKAQTEEHIKEILNKYQFNPDTMKIGSFRSTEEAERHLLENRTSWFEQSCEPVLNFAAFAHDVNFIDQPIAIIHIVSSNDADPSKAVLGLMNSSTQLLNKIWVNNPSDTSSVPKVNFLLFDSDTDDNNIINKKIHHLKQEFPTFQNHFLGYNSVNAEEFDLWTPCITRKYNLANSPPPKGPIRILNKKEKDNIQDRLINLIMQNFVTNIENKINTMDAGITLNRKGIKNTVRNFFKRGGDKPEGSEKFAMNAVEILLRNLADLLFLIQDYDQAANFYKQAASEFKGKSSKHYANSMEMWIYATILSESLLNRKDIDLLFETFELVFNQYHQNQEQLRFAARSLLFLIRTQYIYQRFNKDLIRVVNDQSHRLKEFFPISFPLILEQHSILYLKLAPILPRKYVMHLLFAGHKFYQLNFKNNALRCFMIAFDLYNNTQWCLINGFILTQLSKYFREVGDYSNYLAYLKMACNYLSQKDGLDKQQTTITELSKVDNFLEHLLKENQLTKEKHKQIIEGKVELGLPKVNSKSIDVIHESEALFFVNEKRYDPLKLFINRDQKQPASGSESTWLQLGEIVNGQLEVKYQLPIAAQMKERTVLKTFDCMFLEEKNHLYNSKERTCFVGDDILVSFSFMNPIKIEYEVKDLRPLFEINPMPGAVSGLEMQEPVEAETKDMQVNNLAKEVVCTLRLKPKVQGNIKVTGVMWDLMGLPVRHFFDLKGKKNKDGQSFEKNLKNCFEIVPNTTKMSFNIENYRENIYYGEIRSFDICFRNEGVDQIDKIIIATSAPHVFGFTQLNFNLSLEPGAEIKKKIFLRGSVHFRGVVRVLIKYVSKVNIHKFLRILLPIKVLPSFEINPQALPCNSNYLVNLQIEEYLSLNTQKLQNTISLIDMEDFYLLNIKQVFILSNYWQFDESASKRGAVSSRSFLPLYVKPTKGAAIPSEIVEVDLVKDLGPPKIGFDYSKLSDVNFTFEPKKCVVIAEPESSSNWTHQNMKKIFDNFVKEDQRQILETAWDRDENFFDSNLLGLGVYWEFKTEAGETIRGLHSVNKVYMNASLLKSPSVKLNVFDKNPLVYRLYTSPLIRHDFTTTKVCESELEVVLTNYFSDEPVSFKIEFVNGDETFQNKYDIIFPYFTWEGISERDIRDLKKQESASLKLKMCFYDAGLYDILRFRVTFFRNKYTHQMVSPILIRNQEAGKNLESKTYYPTHEEFLVKVERS